MSLEDSEETSSSRHPAGRHGNNLPVWGNRDSMNFNSLILDNVLASPYYKNQLTLIKTYHEVIDEIYYNVGHLEPWERGTRRTTGQTGMCGGVRGVGAGGVVSTPYCLLYKLFTLRPTRKQLYGLLNHADSPYIRAIGFMFIRYCQPPETYWDWFEPYLDDEEKIDPKAGGGDEMTIGQMVKLFMTKIDWYSTLFPRIPVPIQKEIEMKMRERNRVKLEQSMAAARYNDFGEAERAARQISDNSPSDRRASLSAVTSRKDRATRSRSRSRSPRDRHRPHIPDKRRDRHDEPKRSGSPAQLRNEHSSRKHKRHKKRRSTRSRS